jgi:hypothetical protein
MLAHSQTDGCGRVRARPKSLGSRLSEPAAADMAAPKTKAIPSRHQPALESLMKPAVLPGPGVCIREAWSVPSTSGGCGDRSWSGAPSTSPRSARKLSKSGEGRPGDQPARSAAWMPRKPHGGSTASRTPGPGSPASCLRPPPRRPNRIGSSTPTRRRPRSAPAPAPGRYGCAKSGPQGRAGPRTPTSRAPRAPSPRERPAPGPRGRS